MSNKVEVLLKATYTLAESPHWSEREQCLYFVDMLRGHLCRYDPATKEASACDMGETELVTTAVPVKDTPGQFIVSRGKTISHLHWTPGHSGPSKPLTVLATLDEHAPDLCNNDGKCDQHGRFVVGTIIPDNQEEIDAAESFCDSLSMIKENAGSVYSFSGKKELPKHLLNNITLSNGLCWSVDGKMFYHVDMARFTVYGYDYCVETGDLNVASRRNIFDFRKNGVEGSPDGMTIDTRGHLWVAMAEGSAVVEVDPKSGRLLERLFFPQAPHITSVAFGGPDYRDLYVTSCRFGKTGTIEELDGSLFRISDLKSGGEEVKGLAPFEFPAECLN